MVSCNCIDWDTSRQKASHYFTSCTHRWDWGVKYITPAQKIVSLVFFGYFNNFAYFVFKCIYEIIFSILGGISSYMRIIKKDKTHKYAPFSLHFRRILIRTESGVNRIQFVFTRDNRAAFPALLAYPVMDSTTAISVYPGRQVFAYQQENSPMPFLSYWRIADGSCTGWMNIRL